MKEKSTIKSVPIQTVKPDPRNARIHSPKKIAQLAACIKEFDILMPIVIDEDHQVLAGHARLEAAKLLGLERVDVVSVTHLSEAQKLAFMLADNRLAEMAVWDNHRIREIFEDLIILQPDFSLDLTGFTFPEIDQLLTDEDVTDLEPYGGGNCIKVSSEPPVTELGDTWVAEPHKFTCGDAQDEEVYQSLLPDDEKAQMVNTDPPYGVPIQGHVRRRDNDCHDEFVMGSGEMSFGEYVAFLRLVFTLLVRFSVDGSVHFIAMDWRHMAEIMAASDGVYSLLLNLCVWAKTNGGMGSLYRSQHELFFVYKAGQAKHINNIELGKHGRYRTNVWSYAGANGFGPTRDDDLAMHPTVKPVALVADAILDCSRRNGIVLDPFAGSGTTLVAAHKTGRRGYGIELDPHYCDVIAQRMRKLTGRDVVLAETGETFEQVARRRASERQEG